MKKVTCKQKLETHIKKLLRWDLEMPIEALKGLMKLKAINDCSKPFSWVVVSVVADELLENQ